MDEKKSVIDEKLKATAEVTLRLSSMEIKISGPTVIWEYFSWADFFIKIYK